MDWKHSYDFFFSLLLGVGMHYQGSSGIVSFIICCLSFFLALSFCWSSSRLVTLQTYEDSRPAIKRSHTSSFLHLPEDGMNANSVLWMLDW